MNEPHDSRDPLDRRLRRDLAHLDTMGVRDADGVRSAVASATRRHARNRRFAAGGVSVALTVGVVALVAANHGSSGIAGDTTPSTSPAVVTADSVPPTVGSVVPTTVTSTRWTPLPPDPRGVAYQPSAVWTGTEAIVLGGNDAQGAPLSGGSAYNPTTNSWRRIADPLGVGAVVDPLVAWVGTEMLMIGGSHPDGTPVTSAGQAYDPATDTWTFIAPPFGGSATITARAPWVWTGKEFLVARNGGDEKLLDMAYSPATNSWRTLSAPPIASRQSAASVWTGTEWIVWGGQSGTDVVSDGAAYNPTTDTWRLLAKSPLSARRAAGVWTGTEMIVDAGSSGGDPVTGNGEFAHSDGAAYNPTTDTWRVLREGPAHPGFVPIWTGKYMVMFAKASGIVYDVAADHWTGCCDENGPFGTPVWTGTEAIVLGGADASSGGAVFRLP